MTAQDSVIFEAKGRVGIITLNRPDKRNAINARTGGLLRDIVDRLESDDGLSVGILRSNGNVFCAGMDLLAFTNGEAEEILFGPGGFGGIANRERSKPIIAAVQGPVLAGGFELMMSCDMVIAAETCTFGLPEAKRGLFAGAGGVFRLAERLPPVIAHEIALIGNPFDAQRALQLGLVNRLVPQDELLEQALALAESIAANAPLSIAYSMELVRAARAPEQERLWNLNNALLEKVIMSDDAQEGALAFTEKRQPVWRGS